MKETKKPAAPQRHPSFLQAQVLLMKATRLKQDLDRLHEAKDRVAALGAVTARLKKLQDDQAKLKPATPAAQAKADAAKAMLTVVGAKLAAARTSGAKQKDTAEEEF